MRSGVRALIGTGALALACAAPGAASANTQLSVGCGFGSYRTIQAAVNAAPANSRITVCPGTYFEQVNIPAGKGHLVLVGASEWNLPVIQFPVRGETVNGPNGADAVVSMSTAAGDTYELTDFVVQGPWTDGSNGRHFGVYVVGSGMARITGDTITNIEDSVLANQSAYDGFGVSIGDSSLFDDGAEVPGNAILSDSKVLNYQQFGVSVSVAGSSGTVKGDVIKGLAGGIVGTPLVGLVVGDGASAVVHDNSIAANINPTAVAGNDQTQGDGVFVGFAPSSVTLYDNALNRNDIGLEINGASGVQSSNDTMRRNNFDGIHVDAQDPFGDPSANNTLSNDNAVLNGVYDCEDDTSGSATAGTADTWSQDFGLKTTPAGICTANGNGNGNGNGNDS